jgi:hypothetical protein
LLTGLSIIFLRQLSSSWLTIFPALAVYCAVVLLAGTIDRHDIEVLRMVLRGKKFQAPLEEAGETL